MFIMMNYILNCKYIPI